MDIKRLICYILIISCFSILYYDAEFSLYYDGKHVDFSFDYELRHYGNFEIDRYLTELEEEFRLRRLESELYETIRFEIDYIDIDSIYDFVIPATIESILMVYTFRRVCV